jgi:hypothetical protein
MLLETGIPSFARYIARSLSLDFGFLTKLAGMVTAFRLSCTGSATGSVATSTNGSATDSVATSTAGSATGSVATSTNGSATDSVEICEVHLRI